MVEAAAPGFEVPATVWVPLAEFVATVRRLVESGARHVMLVGLDLSGLGAGDELAVEEVLELPGGPLTRIATRLPASESRYPSLTPMLPAAAWDEREAWDLLGIEPVGHPDPRPLLLHSGADDLGHPLRKSATSARDRKRRVFRPFVAHGEGVYQLPVGPIHAGIIEPGHFRFSVVGESVLFLDARLGYTHRGIERLVEGRVFEAALPIVERACGVCTVTHALAYSRAVEQLTLTEVPPRARLGRVLLAELERLYNHVGDLGNMCAGIGFHSGTSRLGWQKERLQRINEGLVGHRYLMGAVAPGGLRFDLPTDALAGLPAELEAISREVRAIVRSLVRSEGLMARLHGTGVVSRETAERLGAVGVAARASGLPFDLRCDRPYEAYAELEVPLVIGTMGDVAERFHVRAQELVASFALVREVARRLAAGPYRVPLATVPAAGASTIVGVEGPRGPSWLWLMAGPDGSVERLHLRSASFANWPVVAAAAPGNLVPDFPLINKSFELCYACTDR
jgi:Ni,Fe-hydrogenase III large subunit/Ni,Fe-hydrogenase III component G